MKNTVASALMTSVLTVTVPSIAFAQSGAERKSEAPAVQTQGADSQEADTKSAKSEQSADTADAQEAKAEAGNDRSAANTIIASWPELPRLGANQMLEKYGTPQEITAERLVWKDKGQFKRITVTKQMHHHDFPKPHMDFMEHTINYLVPADKADELTAFDGSLTYDRTRGEMSARCDLEGHNLLTLNIANDVIKGKKSVEQARKDFGKIVSEDMQGKNPAYTAKLQFQIPENPPVFADVPVMPGAPKRLTESAKAKTNGEMSDAEILAMMGAANENSILAAMEASQKDIDPQIAEFAKTLHKTYGENQADTMKLSQKLKVTPQQTAAVEELRIKGAGELAPLVSLNGEEFEKAYLETMIKDQTAVLEMIDNQLLPGVSDAAVKKNLTESREDIVRQIEKAKKLQAS